MLRFQIAVITLLIASTVVALTLSVAFASQTSYIDIKPYKPPTLDGTIKEGEYPEITIEVEGFKLYASENGSHVFFSALISDISQDGCLDNVSLAFDVGNHKSTYLMTDDLLFVFCRDGSYTSYYGTPSRWSPSRYAGLTLNITNSANFWSFESALPYSLISIEKGITKTFGFALFKGDGGTVLSIFPTNASYLSPCSWSVLNSSASWGVPDISVRVVLDPVNPKTNETVKFFVRYRNEGDSEVLGVRVNMSVDGVVVESRLDNQTLRPYGGDRSMEFEWIAVSGSHRVKIEVLSSGFDANMKNNMWDQILEVSNISLVFLGPDGFIIYVDDHNGTITGGELSFSVPYGYRRLRCITALSIEPDVEMRFAAWRLAGESIKENSINILVEDDLTLQIDYEKWFNVTFDFKDARRRSLKAENYTVVFYDQGSLVASKPSLWIKEGNSFRLTKVYWEGVEVLRDEMVEIVTRARVYEVACKVYDITLNIIDPLGLPVSRAKVDVQFINGTTVTFETNDRGVLEIVQIPLGKIEGKVNTFGFTQTFSADATINPSLKIVTKFSMYVLAIFLVPVFMILVMVLVFAMKGRAKGKTIKAEKKETSPFEF